MNAKNVTRPELGKGMYTIPLPPSSLISQVKKSVAGSKNTGRWSLPGRVWRSPAIPGAKEGEEPGFIASVYGLSDQQIEDARQFMKRLAA